MRALGISVLRCVGGFADLHLSCRLCVSARSILSAAMFCTLVLNHISYAQSSAERKLKSQTLTPSQIVLVQGSRSAILSRGISAPYFDKHFKLDKVVDNIADRRVAWKYTIGEYEAILNDEIGFYTDEKGRRVDVHGIRDVVGSAHDIVRTISRNRARKLMSKCLGKYTSGEITYQAFGPDRRASLLFTASTLPIFVNTGNDKNRPVVYTGFVNLETGVCTKGMAQAGRPRAPEN